MHSLRAAAPFGRTQKVILDASKGPQNGTGTTVNWTAVPQLELSEDGMSQTVRSLEEWICTFVFSWTIHVDFHATRDFAQNWF